MKGTVKPIALTVLFVAAALVDACTARKESRPENERIAAAPAAPVTCESLNSLHLPHTTIKSATLTSTLPCPEMSRWPCPCPGPPPPYCKVEAVVAPAITIEVWMPSSGWNGKFQGVGNGGFAGIIPTYSMCPALKAGYATAGTDTGHTGVAGDASWALGKPELVTDFASRAIHVMTDTAKAVIKAFYGVPLVALLLHRLLDGRQAGAHGGAALPRRL